MALLRVRDKKTGKVREVLALRGEKGDRGADGNVSFDELTEEQKASLKGEDGYTPQRGIDYYTDGDIEDMVTVTTDRVLAALPNLDEVKF